MRNNIKLFLEFELTSIKKKEIKHRHFTLTKDIRRNRIDFKFFKAEDNFKIGHISISFNNGKLKVDCSQPYGSIFQTSVFNLFCDVSSDLIDSLELKIIKTINTNKVYF